MVIQNPDGSLVQDVRHGRLAPEKKHTYYAELPRHQLDEHATLMEHLIAYAFDVLGALHLEVRVLDPE
ncbi:MAG TPA: hypothetical protein VNL77_25055 [Roseiflexaceae bacterium]|nr:hypothetical protein [Roseiflexaceae bacterium]